MNKLIVNTQTPLVSVGLAVCNEEKYVSEVIESILNQTYQNIELCISDNASTDNTLDIIQEYCKNYKNISVNINQSNLGVVDNMLITLDLAAGDYFFWAAADDLYETKFIESCIYDLQKNSNATCIMSSIKEIELSTNNLIREIHYAKNFNDLNQVSQARKILTAKAYIRSEKYNLFTRGIFKTTFLKDAFKSSPRILHYGDRLLPAIAAMSGGLRYLDEVLFIRRLRSKEISFHARYKSDPYAKFTRKKHEAFMSLFFEYSLLIFKTKTISITSKIASIYVTSSFFHRAISDWMYKYFKKPVFSRLSENNKNKLRIILNKLRISKV